MKKPTRSATAKSVDELPRKSHPSSMRPVGRAELREMRESDEARARRWRVSLIILGIGLLYAFVAFALHSCRGGA